MSQNIKAHFALFLTQLFFAINFSSIKFLTGKGYAGPFGLNLVRVLFTVILLWIVFLAGPRMLKFRKKDALRFVLSALTGIALNQMLFVKGLSLTSSIHASLLMLTTPIMIIVLATLVYRERLGLNKIAGLILGISGASLLILSGKQTGNAEDIFLGDLLVIINAMSYALYFIIVKPLMTEYDGVTVIRYIFTIGLFFMLPFCWREFIEFPWASYDLKAAINLFLVVFCGTFLTYLFNIYGLRKLGASVAGAYIYLQPLLASIIAVIFMQESLHIYKLASAAMIFTGVYLVSLRGRKNSREVIPK